MSSGKIWFDKDWLKTPLLSHIYKKETRKEKTQNNAYLCPKPLKLIFTAQ